MPDNIIPIAPPPAKSSGEIFFERVENLLDKIDRPKIVRFLKVLRLAARLAFRFVPMTTDEKKLFDDVMGAGSEAIDALERNP